MRVSLPELTNLKNTAMEVLQNQQNAPTSGSTAAGTHGLVDGLKSWCQSGCVGGSVWLARLVWVLSDFLSLVGYVSNSVLDICLL